MRVYGQATGYRREGNRGSDRVREADTVHCVHCDKLVAVVTARKGRICKRCMGPVCAEPDCNVSPCTPLRAWLEGNARAIERRLASDQFAEAVGLVTK